MVDIHEELPALPEQPRIEPVKGEAAGEESHPKMRYLIKKGGKQTMGESRRETAATAATRTEG